MKIGYIRVSKHEQNEALQRDALQEAKCEKYFGDTMTGAKFKRKGLGKLLETMQSWKKGNCADAVMIEASAQ